MQCSVPAHALVVGDVVHITRESVPADIVLLEGECTADESSLTGEGIHKDIRSRHHFVVAIPVNKLPLRDPSVLVNLSLRSKKKDSVRFAGSNLIRTASHCRGIVLCTGFHTSKGDLFRSIVCPKPLQFQVERDNYRFLAALSVVAIVTGIYNAVHAYVYVSTRYLKSILCCIFVYSE